jgi:hypothetical protein
MQNEAPFDLSDVTIVNESRSEVRPGDVSVFRTAEDACRYLEAWWVRDGEGTVLSAAGDRLHLTETDPVSVISREPHPNGEHLVLEWLNSHATSVQRARKDAAPLPITLRDLIRYVGFDR